MTCCLLGIGANLGDPARQIADAIDHLKRQPGVQVEAVSRNVITPAVGGPPGQPPYLNAALRIETSLSPEQLLACTQTIERSLGRVSAERWDARPIDLDLLLYGEHVLRQGTLRIPHPWMVARAFVLQPAAEIAPTMRHPIVGWTLERLWQHLRSAPPRFALAGCHEPSLLAQLTGQLTTVLPQARVAPAAEQVPPPYGFATTSDADEQLQWLMRRVELLEASRWNEPPAHPQLAPFWLGESRLAAQMSLEPAAFARFERQFDVLTQPIAVPKLVILALGYWNERRPEGAVDGEQLREACRRYLVARDEAPFIEVETNRSEDFLREVLGALAAMQLPNERPLA